MALKPTNNVIETLKMLGLTGTQARIYFFILKEGHVTARHVSKDLSIARETVYHTLSTLDELGLIVKHLTASPTLYEVLSAKDAITVLLQNKKQEYSKASKTANNMIAELSKYTPKVDAYDSKPFLMIKNDGTRFKELFTAMLKVKHTVDFTTRYNFFLRAFNDVRLSDWIRKEVKAEKRGVKFRMLLDKPIGEEKPLSDYPFIVPESTEFFKNKDFIEYRYSPSPLKCVMIIFDNEKCLIETSPDFDTRLGPVIWTNNSVLATLCTEYFEKNWAVAFKPALTPSPSINV